MGLTKWAYLIACRCGALFSASVFHILPEGITMIEAEATSYAEYVKCRRLLIGRAEKCSFLNGREL